MSTIRCVFCHEYIPAEEYPAHAAEHLKLRSDGQQTEYATLPPEEREDADLTDVPRIYRHRKCSGTTGMPEEIVRSYLKDPFLYSADRTFCCTCGKHVPFRECVWVETGEDLQTYMDKLRGQSSSDHSLGWLTSDSKAGWGTLLRWCFLLGGAGLGVVLILLFLLFVLFQI